MDDHRFDELARSFAENRELHVPDRGRPTLLDRLVFINASRRLVVTGTLAAVFLSLDAGLAEAQCRSKKGKNKRRCRRRHRQPADVGGGKCVPLGQICDPIGVFNPCCDANAVCERPRAGENFLFLCLDKSDPPCTSDAECHAQFPNPDVICLARGPSGCRRGIERCCQRKSCSTNTDCFNDNCCGGVCCDSSQKCIPFVNLCFAA